MTPGETLALPQVVYRVVEENLLPARTTDERAQAYGFNDGAIWDYGAGVEGDGRYLRWIRRSLFAHFHHSTSTRSFSRCSAPDHPRMIEPMEGDLAKQVEYDMDEQGPFLLHFPLPPPLTQSTPDQAWIDNINHERSQKGHPPVSYELFEVLFDKLEKEWFDLVCPLSYSRVVALG